MATSIKERGVEMYRVHRLPVTFGTVRFEIAQAARDILAVDRPVAGC